MKLLFAIGLLSIAINGIHGAGKNILKSDKTEDELSFDDLHIILDIYRPVYSNCRSFDFKSKWSRRVCPC